MSLEQKRASLLGSDSQGKHCIKLTKLIFLIDGGLAPVRMIVSTTRSPRIFPIKSNMSTLDQIIDKKMP